jgi:ABC-type oligopeptide transport system substrate-binding subunit
MATPSRGPLAGRLLVGLLALTFAITAGGWLTALADGDQKKGQEEEEETTKDKKKGKRPQEEEEERPSRPRKVIKVDDDEPAPAKPRPKLQPPPPTEAQTSIVEALRDTKNPELRAFYTNLKVPHDNITVRGLNDSLLTRAIDPLTQYYQGEQTHFTNGYIQVWTYDAEWRQSKSPVKYPNAVRIQPYEEIVVEEVDKFLKTPLDQKAPTDPRYLSRADMLKAAETVLASADRFHASAREKGERRGDAWNPVGQALHERLFRLQLERLDLFAAAGDWDVAAGYARSLADAYREPKERTPIAQRLVTMINDALKVKADDDSRREARQRLRFLEDVFPGSEALRPVADGLRRQAQALLEEARRLREAKKYQEAAARMELARDIYPTLPELADEMASLDRDHPILRVAVRELPLPDYMVPGRATTDADLRAIELMYEGLVKLRVEPNVGQRYEPALAAGMPALIPLGREFRIARGATWSDGTPVTVGDVKETLRVMRQENKWPGYSPMWNKMIEDAEGGGNSFRLSLRLSQGYFDPLSLMTFKVLPHDWLREDLRPGKLICSGPFQYKETISTTSRNLKTAVFYASGPGYSNREGKLGLPRIREIHLIHYPEPREDAADALKKKEIDMALDLSAKKARELNNLRDPALEVRGPLANRRVYFLAINHRSGALKNNPYLRRALALAIDRETLLDNNFRDTKGTKAHHALSSPVPAGSWPCIDDKNAPVVPQQLYNADAARGEARQAVTSAGGPIKLTLLYPAGDAATKAALEELCRSVSEKLRIDDKTFIELQPEEELPQKFRERVEREHKYELAYCHYDHPSEAFWLAPLFDLGATDIWGSNYLGYLDSELQQLFETAKNHRYFGEVQKTMNLVVRMLDQKMPLVPLWQLDTFYAYRTVVKPTGIDPLLIFNDVERWSLEPKR